MGRSAVPLPDDSLNPALPLLPEDREQEREGGMPLVVDAQGNQGPAGNRRFMRLEKVREALEKIGIDVTSRTMERWAMANVIPCVRLGKLWLLDLRALKAGTDLERSVYEELVSVLTEAEDSV